MYQIRFNVFATSIGLGERTPSFSGHINVTLAVSDQDDGETYGANLVKHAEAPGSISRGFGDTSDGVIQKENHKLVEGKSNWVTRTVPVTESQFYAIKARLEGALNKKYDYAIAPGPDGKSQVCSSFAAAVYRMTGHPYEVGSLFSAEDRVKVPGLVWGWIPVSYSPRFKDRPYRPSEPIIGHYPDTEKLGVELQDEKHQYGDGVKEAEQGIGEFFKSPKVRKLITPLMFPGRMSSADTPGGEPAKPSVRRNPFQEPETVVPRSHMAASGSAEAVTDDEEFDGSTLLTRRRRKKKVARVSSPLATPSAPFDVRQMFPNSDHS